MAFSPLRSKALHHNRSLSLPSKENPAASCLDQDLSTARGSEAFCSSLSLMNNRVTGLKNLYSNIDELLQLPHTHQIISQESQERSIDQVLDGYIRILDACTEAKDRVSNTKQDVQELLSALRRKDAGGIHCYLSSRKTSKKSIQKSLKELRRLSTLEKDCEESDLLHKLKDAESVTVSMLESLLSYLIGTKTQARKSGWSLVAKLMHSKMAYNGEDTQSNEFKKIDDFLQTSLEGVQVEELMSFLKEIDSSIQNLEEELECLFRQLIRTRVFLLNILNN